MALHIHQILVQCWWCFRHEYRSCSEVPETVYCRHCTGPCEKLTIDGIPVK